MAMEARCYHGGSGRTRMRQLKYGYRDGIAFLTVAALLAAIIAMNHFNVF
jgi:energy-coupling factor transport system permease protein